MSPATNPLQQDEEKWCDVNSATSIDDEYHIDLDDQGEPYNIPTNKPYSAQSVVVVTCEYDPEAKEESRSCQYATSLWPLGVRVAHTGNLKYGYRVILENTKDVVSYPAGSIASMNQPLGLEYKTDSQTINFRGVYSPKYEKELIFAENITLQMSEIPDWKPTAMIGKPFFEGDDA
jgi:hypothetical protein